jgi:hypothetical protein
MNDPTHVSFQRFILTLEDTTERDLWIFATMFLEGQGAAHMSAPGAVCKRFFKSPLNKDLQDFTRNG